MDSGQGEVMESRDGTTRRRLAAGHPVVVFRGARTAVEPLTVDERIRAYSAVMRPGEFFSHGTAAHLLGLPGPRPSATTPLHVSVAPPQRAARRVGVRSHHLWDDAVTVVDAGSPVADPASTFCHLSDSRSLDDLVVLGDAIVGPDEDGRRRGWRVDLEVLASRAASFRGRGGRRARDAVPWVRVGAESPMETLLRLLLLRAGLPEPEVNVELYDDEGRFVARVDLLYRARRVVVEYDGDQHRSDRAQYERDIRRIEAIEALGYRVVRVRSAGVLLHPEETVARVRRALFG
ncbi:endonuclease domain-containing protein [Rathayibacter tanaceti]|uniref:DUF559 domain-containing protein n=2 Tax=Rathayibacter tanaceti TaxID=1671680 RepID=A0A168G9Q3_9MICO|nr:DUF559 domain-containing protein [Rathayibacter tanaceti]KZX21934.1 hypothetical protein ACH61_00915 [Rathayibacter tanaceti]QHC56062.1 DUF559 domain-containing protein [Rathayibacter tanaceti]TCO39082.1 uncharacterized protein DUF559 [Rathayibacter tanaceti]